MKIGIISGAGPYAGTVLHQKIIERYNREGCYLDRDFPLIMHVSYPFTSLDSGGLVDPIKAKEELGIALDLLGNVDVVLLACNSLLNCTTKVLDPRPHLADRKYYLLASASSVASGIYGSDMTAATEEEQIVVNNIIEDVMRGIFCDKKILQLVKSISSRYPEHTVLLGCTELCVFRDIPNSVNILDVLVSAL